MNWKRNFYFLWFGGVVSAASYTMIVPFLPVYLFDLGASEASIGMWSGIVFASTFFVSAVLSPYWGRKADKFGKRRMLLRAGFSLGIVYFLGGFVRNPEELLLMRIMQGVSTGFVPASLSIVASTVPENKIGFYLGSMQAANLIGGIMGPLIGGTLAHLFGIRSSFVVAGTALLIGTVLLSIYVEEPPKQSAPPEGSLMDDFRHAVRSPILREMLLITIVAQFAVMIAQPLIALYVKELSGTMEGVSLTSGIIVGGAGVAGAIAAPLWGRLGQDRGYAKVLAIVFFGIGVADVLQITVNGVFLFGVLQFLFGFFIAGALPMVNTIITAHSDASFRGRAFGLVMSANQAGSMFGPLVGGAASAVVGIKGVLVATGFFLLLVAAWLWIARRNAYKRSEVFSR